jgi:hypothetical protein
MKKIFLVLGIAMIYFLILKVYFLRYQFKYYYSKDKSKILTRITGPNMLIFAKETYFTPGYYKDQKIPDIYLKPIPSSHGEWAEYIRFHSKGIFIIGDSVEIKNLNEEFKYVSGSGNYNHSRYIDSIVNSLRDIEMFAVYSFDR